MTWYRKNPLFAAALTLFIAAAILVVLGLAPSLLLRVF